MYHDMAIHLYIVASLTYIFNNNRARLQQIAATFTLINVINT